MSSPVANATKMANAAANATKVASAATNATANAAANAAANGTASAADKAKNFLKDNMPLVIFFGVVVLIFLIVIIYITFAMRGAGLSGKTLTTTPIRLDGNNAPMMVPSDKIPIPSVGREYTYSFWVYLENFNQTPGNQKMLWYRGQDNDISNANPIVYLEDMSNKMHFVIKTQNSVLSSQGPTNYNADVGKVKERNYFLNQNLTMADEHNKHILVTVDYVPLQRWVNYVVIVDNKLVTVYMDGEIYSVKSIDEYKATKPREVNEMGQPYDYNLIIDKTEGNIYVGKNPSDSANVTINGYLSKMDFFSYAISVNDVKKVYNNGPFTKSALSAFGGSYAVRSPVYRLDTPQS